MPAHGRLIPMLAQDDDALGTANAVNAALDNVACIIGPMLGAAVNQTTFPHDKAEQAIQALEKLRADIGIPLRLRDIGVTADMLPGFAEKAFGIKRLLRVNPRMPASADEILAIYKAAF